MTDCQPTRRARKPAELSVEDLLRVKETVAAFPPVDQATYDRLAIIFASARQAPR